MDGNMQKVEWELAVDWTGDIGKRGMDGILTGGQVRMIPDLFTPYLPFYCVSSGSLDQESIPSRREQS